MMNNLKFPRKSRVDFVSLVALFNADRLPLARFLASILPVLLLFMQ
jgi:hypothetical protein